MENNFSDLHNLIQNMKLRALMKPKFVAHFKTLFIFFYGYGINYCICLVWYGGNQPEAQLRGCFINDLELVCNVGSGVSYCPSWQWSIDSAEFRLICLSWRQSYTMVPKSGNGSFDSVGSCQIPNGIWISISMKHASTEKDGVF